MYYIYILRNHRNHLYIGHADDLDARLSEHKAHHGAKFIKDHVGFELVHTEVFETRAQAMHRKKQLKTWSHAKKEALISGNLESLQKL